MMKLSAILEVRPSSICKTKGVLSLGGLQVPCALGRSGVTQLKREGDGATPRGSFELLNVYYRSDRGARPKTALPVSAIAQDDGWCDAPGHPRYNRPVKLPFAPSHETLWREDRLYDIVVVLDCNMYPAVSGRGSAIFFHIAREGYTPTEGCVAVAPKDMQLILDRVQPGDQMRVY